MKMLLPLLITTLTCYVFIQAELLLLEHQNMTITYRYIICTLKYCEVYFLQFQGLIICTW